MSKKQLRTPAKGAARVVGSIVPSTADHAEKPTEPHTDVTSPAFVHANDRMKLASKPNDGQPLAHRDRGKAGRKG